MATMVGILTVFAIILVANPRIYASACDDPGIVPSDCMNCICQIESRCNAAIGCQMDVGTFSCGPYQIKEPYYTDASKYSSDIGPDWKTCTTGPDAMCCSMKTAQAYISHYAAASRIGHQPTCEDMSRIHNGGPYGYLRSSTLPYWNKIKNACMENNK